MSMWPKFGQLLQEKTGGFKVLDQPIAEKKLSYDFACFHLVQRLMFHNKSESRLSYS